MVHVNLETYCIANSLPVLSRNLFGAIQSGRKKMPVQASGQTKHEASGFLSGVQKPRLLKLLFDVVLHSQQHLKINGSRHVECTAGRRQVGVY